MIEKIRKIYYKEDIEDAIYKGEIMSEVRYSFKIINLRKRIKELESELKTLHGGKNTS